MVEYSDWIDVVQGTVHANMSYKINRTRMASVKRGVKNPAASCGALKGKKLDV